MINLNIKEKRKIYMYHSSYKIILNTNLNLIIFFTNTLYMFIKNEETAYLKIVLYCKRSI